MSMGAPHLLPGNAPHLKNCTNLISGSGNNTMNNIGVGNRMPQGNFKESIQYTRILELIRINVNVKMLCAYFQFHQRIM